MKPIQTVDTEDTILCHDIIQIIKGVTKGVVFHKGHMATEEDTPVLLSVGKDQLYIWEREDGILHENDATEIPYDTYKGQNMECPQAREEKTELTIVCDNLLKVDNRGLRAVNGPGQMMITARHGSFVAKKGDKLTGTRIIPPMIEEKKMEAAKRATAEATGGCPILELKPFLYKKAGIVTTGNEVFCGRIQDTFTLVIQGELSEFDTEAIDHVTWNDDDTKVTASTLNMTQKGVDVVVCAGGMSVDPDDKTPLAIRSTGMDIILYGAPVLPGAMFPLVYYQIRDGESPRTVAVIRFPGCVMYAERVMFDLVLPRIMADDQVTTDDLTTSDQGGLCLNCSERTFPNCGSSKGI